MITASVSLAPIVVAENVAENQVQHRISSKVMDDKIKTEAELMVKIVTDVSNSSRIAPADAHSIDIRI